ncbi:hypothetical protein [Parafrankia discariae]|uniref:hypothetical protein n=1 Tax=Parafrankia discariae TaxID=365528 RepID=UPI00037981D3|nr:hypothetical protein [Parafrankia discariae]
MVAPTRKQLDSWIEDMQGLYAILVNDPTDVSAAREAVANLWSEYGDPDMPADVADMLIQAIEIGYAAALRDVRDGDFDDDIREWRPDLAD